MIDLRGLIVGTPDAHGFCEVQATPVNADLIARLQIVPGPRWEAGRFKIPANFLPPNGAGSLPEVVTPSGLKLRRYQIEAVEFVENSDKGCIEADDVGCGKTVVAAEYARRHPELRPFLIVGPLIASGSWVGPNADPEKHFGLRVVALHTLTPGEEKLPRVVDGHRVDGYFINYEILPAWMVWVKLAIDPKIVIVDEAHEIRNSKSARKTRALGGPASAGPPRGGAARAVHNLCRLRSIQKRILLTATPVVNKVADLYQLLDTAQPGLWGHYLPWHEKIHASFAQRYCSAEHNGYGWQVDGESNTAELKQRLSSVMIRRSRFDLRKELPPLEIVAVPVESTALDATTFAEYCRAANDTARLFAAGQLRNAVDLQRATAMASLLSWSKRDIAVDRAENLVRSVEGYKLVIYTWYKKTAQYITKKLKRKGLSAFGPITGETPIKRRLEQAQAFKDLRLPPQGGAVFVATLGAAGVSLNPLSAAAAELFVDLYWVPAVLLQAIGRVHREGQRAASVLVQFLTVKGSIDEIMFQKLERKAKTIASTTNDTEGQTLCEALGGRNEQESLKALLTELAGLSDTSMELK